jgi:putative cardiolipin synthase
VRVLTNSLAATDVAAVHSGYARYRVPLLAAGIELFELKTAPEESESERRGRLRVGSSKASLHTKAAILDGRHLFVGSFNLDPRSATLNCEMGVWIEDVELARQLASLFDRATQPTHSFAVRIDEQGRLAWTEQVHSRVVEVHREPYASWGRRLLTALLRLLPIESQL